MRKAAPILSHSLSRKKVGLMKEKYDHRLLLKHLPSDFRQLLEHLQTLEYADKPDYAMLLGLFERTMKRRGVRESDPFDWEKNAAVAASANSSVAATDAANAAAAASTNPANAIATGSNVALGSRNTAHLQATSAIPVSALAAAATNPDNQEKNLPQAAAAAVDNQENLEPDNRKAAAAAEGDPKAMPRAHHRTGNGTGEQGTAAAAGESPRAKAAEMDKNCNANVVGRKAKDESEKAAEKAVDPEGDAVMAVVGGGGGGGGAGRGVVAVLTNTPLVQLISGGRPRRRCSCCCRRRNRSMRLRCAQVAAAEDSSPPPPP